MKTFTTMQPCAAMTRVRLQPRTPRLPLLEVNADGKYLPQGLASLQVAETS